MTDPFTAEEAAFLAGQRLGRIATASASSEPDVAPVGFAVRDGVVEIAGFDNTKTRKFHNIKANPRASFVVDDLLTVDPWQPRGLNPDAPKLFAGKIEKRSIR